MNAVWRWLWSPCWLIGHDERVWERDEKGKRLLLVCPRCRDAHPVKLVSAMKTEKPHDRFLTPRQVADRWGISIKTLQRQLANATIRVIPCTRMGRSYRWRESEIEQDIRRATLTAGRSS